MQKNKQIQKQQAKSSYEVLPLKLPLVIPSEIYSKMQTLCHYIPDVEWSGILLYEATGDISNPSSMSILLKDIIPMHKGTATTTGYNLSEPKRDSSGFEDAHMDYCEQFNEAMRWKIGMIHSHNVMEVFFSGTDLDELIENSPSHNYYLSLIVNNKMEIIARVGVASESVEEIDFSYQAMNSLGQKYTIHNEKRFVKSIKTYMYDCDITIEGSPRTFDFFESRLSSILNKKNSSVQGHNMFGNHYDDFEDAWSPWIPKKKAQPVNNNKAIHQRLQKVTPELPKESFEEFFTKDVFGKIYQNLLESEDIMDIVSAEEFFLLLEMHPIVNIQERFLQEALASAAKIPELSLEDCFTAYIIFLEGYEITYPNLQELIEVLDMYLKNYKA